jgi:hypothetical protein
VPTDSFRSSIRVAWLCDIVRLPLAALQVICRLSNEILQAGLQRGLIR